MLVVLFARKGEKDIKKFQITGKRGGIAISIGCKRLGRTPVAGSVLIYVRRIVYVINRRNRAVKPIQSRLNRFIPDNVRSSAAQRLVRLGNGRFVCSEIFDTTNRFVHVACFSVRTEIGRLHNFSAFPGRTLHP